MELHGVTGKPYNAPRTQRAIPAPFSRPSINAGGETVRRTWKQTKALDLNDGDVVAGVGKIRHVERWVINRPHEYRVHVTNVLGDIRVYGVHESVFAFSRD